jgi:hypothetical protein
MPTSDGTGIQMSDGMAPEPTPFSVPAAEPEPGSAPALPLAPPEPLLSEALPSPPSAPAPAPVPPSALVPPPRAATPAAHWFGTPPPPPPGPGRGRRRGFIALAVIAIAGLAIGLLVAQPWEPPPLLAPVAVRAAATSTTAAALSWHQAPGGRRADSWVVVRNGERYAVVPGAQLTFADTKLAPGGTYAYRIYETSGTARSRGSALASVQTAAPSVRNLRQVGKGWSTATLRWDPPAGAPAPDNYTISDSTGTSVGSVTGSVTTYTITKLPVGGDPGTYAVSAIWSGNRSDTAPSVSAVTRQPPLNSDYSMSYYDASSPGGTMKAGTKWTDNWTFTPSCAGNACKEALQASFQPPATRDTPFNVTLKPSGGHYIGTTHAQIFACSATASASYLDTTNDTVNVDITPVRASGGVWSAFTGTVVVTMPYTVPVLSPNTYCPTQSWTFSVNGHAAS